MYSKISNIKKSLSTNINSMKWTLWTFQSTLWTIIKIILRFFRQNIGTPFFAIWNYESYNPFLLWKFPKKILPSPPPSPSTQTPLLVRIYGLKINLLGSKYGGCCWKKGSTLAHFNDMDAGWFGTPGTIHGDGHFQLRTHVVVFNVPIKLHQLRNN